MLYINRFVRIILPFLAALIVSFVLTVSVRTGKFPTLESSRKILAETVPFFDDTCRFPKPYRIGLVDPRFNLSKEAFSSAISEATLLWEKGIGKRVLVADDRSNSMPINLVFDDRQAETDSLKEASMDIDTQRSTYERLRIDYGNAKKVYDSEKSSYDDLSKQYAKHLDSYKNRVSRYNDRLTRYTKQVAQWNASGGAPKDEFDELQDEGKNLDKEASAIKSDQKDLDVELTSLQEKAQTVNGAAGKVNSLAGNLNRLARGLNIAVESYNQVAGSREEFTTGLYVDDASGKRIDVFQFYDHNDLVKILAHEIGHALGLAHAADTMSIMYPSVGEQSLSLTDEDKALFRSICP